MRERRSNESPVTLYVIPLSHAAHTARLMLEYKGIEHRVVALLSGLHPLLLRAMGFERGTVPALRVGRRRVQGSLSISRALDEMKPSPPLFPSDVQARRRVEQAERWGAEELQAMTRRLYRWALVEDPRVRRGLSEANRLPFIALAARAMKPLAAYFAHLSGARDATVRSDLRGLASMLDRVEALLRDGVIGNRDANAADFQIATSLRLLLTFADLREAIASRPAGIFALRRIPNYPGEVPAVFPPDWLRSEDLP